MLIPIVVPENPYEMPGEFLVFLAKLTAPGTSHYSIYLTEPTMSLTIGRLNDSAVLHITESRQIVLITNPAVSVGEIHETLLRVNNSAHYISREHTHREYEQLYIPISLGAKGYLAPINGLEWMQVMRESLVELDFDPTMVKVLAECAIKTLLPSYPKPY